MTKHKNISESVLCPLSLCHQPGLFAAEFQCAVVPGSLPTNGDSTSLARVMGDMPPSGFSFISRPHGQSPHTPLQPRPQCHQMKSRIYQPVQLLRPVLSPGGRCLLTPCRIGQTNCTRRCRGSISNMWWCRTIRDSGRKNARCAYMWCPILPLTPPGLYPRDSGRRRRYSDPRG